MFNREKKNNNIILNQLKSKLLINNFYSFDLVKFIQLQLNLRKLKSFNDIMILEGFFLLEFLSSLKAAVTYYKKTYQEVNVQIVCTLRKISIFYFIYLLKIFYFPILLRRNEFLSQNYDNAYNYSLTISNVNMLPFVPDIFFKWNIPICCLFNFNSKNLVTTQLILKYFNFSLEMKN